MSSLAEAVSLITEVEERIGRVREILQREAGAPVAGGPWPGGLLLAEILEEGGSVTREQLYELATKYGFDKRGLGGFYTGKGSLQMIEEKNRVMLTPEGVKTARKYLQQSRPYEAGEPSLARAADASFAADWNSDQDAIYDDV